MDLFTFARTGDTVLLQEIDDGYNVNSTNEHGESLVLLAARHGHSGLVRGLVARGADVKSPNPNGLTPVAAAAAKGYDDVVGTLLHAGAVPRADFPAYDSERI
ncbi:ankyrin repeat domain-containing protein [Microbacterium halotolerans]|uniref:ankyrin repeat domain-containing protein n=1 Tax=Microbacterium halotolerans TaxID=246613 RepID=UPI000E6AD33F|nr:ankyrin repeat domain-containing protein [Microbacterium halotolerans]